MNKHLKEILDLKKYSTSYGLGLLQANGYRILKNRTKESLAPFNINTIEWSVLGLLYEKKEGLRLLDIASAVMIKPPFISNLIYKLEGENLVKRIPNPSDRRALIIKLSEEGREFVTRTDEILKKNLRPLIKDLSMKEIICYIKVLRTIEGLAEEEDRKSIKNLPKVWE